MTLTLPNIINKFSEIRRAHSSDMQGNIVVIFYNLGGGLAVAIDGQVVESIYGYLHALYFTF